MLKFEAMIFGGELPIGLGVIGIAVVLPRGDFGHKLFRGCDTPVQALAAQHANLDLDYVQPAGVLGDIVELPDTRASFRRRLCAHSSRGRAGLAE